jgi:hypothetical protein
MTTQPTTNSKSTVESLVEEGIKQFTNQQTINGVTIATAMKTFFNLDDKQAAAIGVGYALLSDHLAKKELNDGN